MDSIEAAIDNIGPKDSTSGVAISLADYKNPYPQPVITSANTFALSK